MVNITRKLLIMLKNLWNNSIGNKMAIQITEVSKYLQQNNSETITNKYDKNYLKSYYRSY